MLNMNADCERKDVGFLCYLVHQLVDDDLKIDGFGEFISGKWRREQDEWCKVECISVKLVFLSHANTLKLNNFNKYRLDY